MIIATPNASVKQMTEYGATNKGFYHQHNEFPLQTTYEAVTRNASGSVITDSKEVFANQEGVRRQ